MSHVKIQFLGAGKWADHPADPIFTVKAGDKKEVSSSLAKIAVEAGKAIFVDLIAEAAAAKAEAAEIAAKEKAEAEEATEAVPKAGPKAKAEGKGKGKG